MFKQLMIVLLLSFSLVFASNGVVINPNSNSGAISVNNTFISLSANITDIQQNLSAEAAARIGNDSLLVPYTGATDNVFLGVNNINATNVIASGEIFSHYAITTDGGVYAASYADKSGGNPMMQWINAHSYWRMYGNWMSINPMNITLNESNSWFNGLFNWVITPGESQNYLSFDGHNLTLNETNFNQTINTTIAGEIDARIANDSVLAKPGACPTGQVVNQTTTTGVVCTVVALISDLINLQTNLSNEQSARIANDSLKAGIGECPTGQVVNGTNATGVMCVATGGSYWELVGTSTLRTITGAYHVLINELLINNTDGHFNAISAVGNLNNYFQFNIQNTNNGGLASADLVATSNVGNESRYFVDMGITNSNYNDTSWAISSPNTSYLYAYDVPLVIGTATPGKDLVFFQGGNATSNEGGRLNSSGFTINNMSSKVISIKNDSFVTQNVIFFNQTSKCLQMNGLSGGTLNVC
jgi:hypothetical protein